MSSAVLKSSRFVDGVHSIQCFARGEREGMHDKVEMPDFLLDAFHCRFDLLVAGNVALNQQGIVERGRQLSNILPEPFALIGQDKPCTGFADSVCNTPGDGPLVGHAHDQSGLSFKQHRANLPQLCNGILRPYAGSS